MLDSNEDTDVLSVCESLIQSELTIEKVVVLNEIGVHEREDVVHLPVDFVNV